jgi:transposase
MGDRLVSTLDHKLEPEVKAVHRLEVISGTGRRRRFSEDFKARVVEETLVPEAIISEVARRHGLTPQQVFTWRRQARQAAEASTEPEAPKFVPAVVEPAPPPGDTAGRQCKRARHVDRIAGLIEVEIEGMTIRIGRGAEAKTVAAVLRVLKAGA